MICFLGGGCMSSNLVKMPFKQLPTSTEHGVVKDPLVKGLCEAGFRGGDMNLEYQKAIGYPSAIDDQHLKTLVEQNSHQRVREMSQAMGVSISTISDPLKRIG